jgi:hypothetical protein
MIFSVDFGSAQTGVGYRFLQSNGGFVGPRVTDNISAGSQPGMFYVSIATLPSSARAIYWDCDDITLTAREDIQEDARLETFLERPPIPAFLPGSNEFYNLAKRAFIESLELVGIPIIFAGESKLCVVNRIVRKQTWQQVGFFPEATAIVDMVDDDFNEFEANRLVEDAQALVELDDTLFQLIEVDREPSDPIVRLHLNKDK